MKTLSCSQKERAAGEWCSQNGVIIPVLERGRGVIYYQRRVLGGFLLLLHIKETLYGGEMNIISKVKAGSNVVTRGSYGMK